MLKRFIYSFIVVGLLVCLLPATKGYATACPGGSPTVTNTNDSGGGSLRGAIASASSGDTVCFNIPGSGVHTITVDPNSYLSISQSLVIDATTQPGYAGVPLIEITGNNATNYGFWISGGNTTIKGFIINLFEVDGIHIETNGGNIIAGNYIGTDDTGTFDRGNGSSGIGILTANNTIGGSTVADRNVLSGNNGQGLVIFETAATGNVVKGNFIGTNAAGTGAIANTVDGILIHHASNNSIGGTNGVTPTGACTGECNLLSGNGANGLGILGPNASGNTMLGNFVGVNVNGTGELHNGDIGMEIQEAANNIIGGTTSGARNILSGNLGAGVSLTRNGATGNQITGNYIGVNSAGNSAIKNHKMGVNIGSTGDGIDNAHDNIIGGTVGTTPGGSCTGACNVIAGNNWSGVYISGASGGNNQIVGNFIGAGASGGWTIPNVLDGIGIVDSPNNRIGGPSASARNIISGNGTNGVAITGGSSNGTRIEGNYIGIATDQNVMPNQVTGVAVGAGVDTAILANSIYGNGFLGIDLQLGGVTPNDGGDPDNGPNRLQNFPVLSYAIPNGSNTNLAGSLNSNASTSYRIEFFHSPSCSQYSYGQGHAYMGGTTVVTSASGNTNFNILLPGVVPGGRAVTATATKLGGSTPFETSEFSACVYSPRQHPDGALIRPSGSHSLFMVESGKNRQFGSVEVLISQFISLSEFKTATSADTSAPGDAGVYFREGTLIKGSGPDVFVIDQTGANTFVKRKITSSGAFNALGYSIADCLIVPDSALAVGSGANISDGSVHPDGALVNSGSTIYLLQDGKKRLVGSPGVYVSHRLSATKLKTATSADIALANGGNLQYREGALLRGNSSSTVFVVDDTGSGIRKRQFGSIQAFIELGYTNTDIIVIPDHELPSTTGPAV